VIPPKSPAAAGAGPDVERLLDHMSALIERFRVESERFLNGVHDADAESLQNRIQRRLRELRAVPIKSAVENFRLTGLEARFNSLSERFGRRLREQEEGRGPAHAADEARELDPERGIVLGRSADPSAVEALLAGLARHGAASKLDLDSFRGYLLKQIDQIHRKTGADRVQFRLAREEGKVKIKARPVGSDESDA
jgi:hypothetical protein